MEEFRNTNKNSHLLVRERILRFRWIVFCGERRIIIDITNEQPQSRPAEMPGDFYAFATNCDWKLFFL